MSIFNNLFGAGERGTSIHQGEENVWSEADTPDNTPGEELHGELPTIDESRVPPIMVDSAKPLSVTLALPALIRALVPDSLVMTDVAVGTTSRQVLGGDGNRFRARLRNSGAADAGEIYIQHIENGTAYTLLEGAEIEIRSTAPIWAYGENGGEILEMVIESFNDLVFTSEY